MTKRSFKPKPMTAAELERHRIEQERAYKRYMVRKAYFDAVVKAFKKIKHAFMNPNWDPMHGDNNKYIPHQSKRQAARYARQASF